MKSGIFKIIPLLLLAGCSTAIKTEYVEVPTLRVSDIYSVDTVLGFMKAYGADNEKIAKSYLDQARSLEAQNPEQAMYHYKRAITLSPSRKAYDGLAALLEKSGDFRELNELYYALINEGWHHKSFLFGPPDLDTWREYCISICRQNRTLMLEDIYSARDAGFDLLDLRKMVLSDPRLGYDTGSIQYKNISLQFEDPEKLEEVAKRPDIFRSFLNSASDSSSSFDIDVRDVSHFNYNNNGYEDEFSIDFRSVYIYYLPEMIEKKNRWLDYNIMHAFDPVPGKHAVVYAVDSSANACPVDMRHIYHRLVIYDDNQKILDQKIIATQSGKDLMTASVRGKMISISTFERRWKNPYDMNDFDNELKGMSNVQDEKFEITEQGRILPLTNL